MASRKRSQIRKFARFRANVQDEVHLNCGSRFAHPSCAGRRSGCLGLGSVLDTNSVPALADSDDRWVAELAVEVVSGQAGVAPHCELEQRLAASGRRAGGAPWVCRWTEGPLPTTEPKGGLGCRGLPVTALLGTHESRDGRGNAC
jgi:hypothetical protein